MTIVTQGARSADFLLSEASGQRSRAQVSLLATAVAIAAGTIVALSGAGYAPYEAAEVDPQNPDAEVEVPTLAILYNNKPPSEEVQLAAVIARDAEVDRSLLIGLDDAAEAVLVAQGIIIRPA
ncbi:head decoration protein [Phytopseudomonas seleniipraecipitans]|uniref:Bacteriophage lambda head decoration protein D n=1 Tax=Phytopseudomonas seleniipraecipitans TaxID=640205 RepID=A0A1G7JCI0_9GAMM|nr:head decoration protein [Pseudomonas seleniipraecipitans]SDF22608.1 Bacteriophage lambda head decoration protein D [Pseudomonas seleniipraecipitans]